MNERDPRISRYAVLQSVTEIGVGSVVHSLRLPLGGHLLSLNQTALLVLASKPDPALPGSETRKRAIGSASGVAFVSALLKGLSPAGKRATPMLAIAMQGALFSSGLALFGTNIVGALLGALLLSVWGFIQPLLLATFIFGRSLLDGIVVLWTELANTLGWDAELGFWILGAVVAAKAVAAIGVAWIAWAASPEREARYLEKVQAWTRRWPRGNTRDGLGSGASQSGRPQSPAIGALLDLCRPIFLVSLAISLIFARGESWVHLSRIVGAGWAIFFLIRAFPSAWAETILNRYPSLRHAAREVFDHESGEVPPRR